MVCLEGISTAEYWQLAGRDFLSLIPLDKTALELSPGLEDWVREVLPGRQRWEVLNPDGWYTRGHEEGHFIWSPAPAIADVALEQMCDAVLCRPWNAHVFICPAHMTYRWRNQLQKMADLVLTIKVGGQLWPAHLHEPLVIGLTCPLLAYSPWRVKRTKRLARGQNPCLKCGAKIGAMKEIFCGNYGYLRSPQIPICYGA